MPKYASGRATNTLPTCSISWEMAVGTMFCCPCMKPRSADMAHTSKRAGAMATKPGWVEGSPERRASVGLMTSMSSVAIRPRVERRHSATRKMRRALRGSSRASVKLTMRLMATGRPAEEMVSSML